MKKVTVFQGTVNGKNYDNVADYNAAITALINAGETDIQATSSTSIKTIDETPQPTNSELYTYTKDELEENDLSFYPYMEDDDPFYLDILATTDKMTNHEAYTEAQNVLAKCYNYTIKVLNDKETDNDERRDYLDDVNKIIEDIDNDLRTTKQTLDGLAIKYDTAKTKYEEAIKKAEEAYEIEKKDISESETVLLAAKRVAELFKTYYSDIASETILAIKEHDCKCDESCGENCKCKCHENSIVTETKEKSPTVIKDFNDILNKIFGDSGLIRMR